MDMELFSESKIGELEEKIDSLINGYIAMKESMKKLTARLRTMEAENGELKEKVNSVRAERELIMEKVKILEKVEKVEV